MCQVNSHQTKPSMVMHGKNIVFFEVLITVVGRVRHNPHVDAVGYGCRKEGMAFASLQGTKSQPGAGL